MARILVVDDDQDLSNSVSTLLHEEGHEVLIAESGAEVIAGAGDEAFDVVLCGLHLKDAHGLDVLRAFRSESPGSAVLITAADASIQDAVEAMRFGAQDFLRKPLDDDELRRAIDKALAPIRRAIQEAAPVDIKGDGRSPASAYGIIGDSRVMRDSMDLVAKVAETDSTVLISGETGTGKELFGRAIHQLSHRRDKVFCAVNSAAFPETLLESELFGHRRGAFTGAATNKKGLFEHTHRGTVFLDEVAEMPLSMQAKLLRFLQTGEIRPVGGEETRFVDVRLVTATNKELESEVASGRFREDLYYRLAVIPVHVPPLRERGEDIPLLVNYFLRRFSARLGKSIESIDSAATDLLMAYSWPGNVRQLENSIERAVALCRGSRIGIEDLPMRLRERSLVREGETIQSLNVIERAHILSTLDKVGWNRKRAAQLLQISTTTLWRRLKEFGIETDASRRPLPPAITRG